MLTGDEEESIRKARESPGRAKGNPNGRSFDITRKQGRTQNDGEANTCDNLQSNESVDKGEASGASRVGRGSWLSVNTKHYDPKS